MSASRRQEFRIEIDGIEFPDDVVQRIDGALRSAVLLELAKVNLGGRSVDLLGEGMSITRMGGNPQGYRVKMVEQ
ncbi:hypothetical protein ACFYSH_16350 [Streptomyces sp. NPDC005791]|uniref:hypothetical protein n=1 Tax=Streptomyces sp. NPDC005791 TaxID=3364732 RepID=UPI0036C69E2A